MRDFLLVTPQFRLAITQPKRRRRRVGRIMLDVWNFRNDTILAKDFHRVMRISASAVPQATRHLCIGICAPAREGVKKLGMSFPPRVDRLARGLKKLRNLIVRRTEQTIVVSLLGIFNFVFRGAAAGHSIRPSPNARAHRCGEVWRHIVRARFDRIHAAVHPATRATEIAAIGAVHDFVGAET